MVYMVFKKMSDIVLTSEIDSTLGRYSIKFYRDFSVTESKIIFFDSLFLVYSSDI